MAADAGEHDLTLPPFSLTTTTLSPTQLNNNSTEHSSATCSAGCPFWEDLQDLAAYRDENASTSAQAAISPDAFLHAQQVLSMRSFRVVRELRVVKFMLKVCHFATVACWSETVAATGINQKPLVTNRVESDNGAAAARLRKDRVYKTSYPAQVRLVYIYLDDGEWWLW